ncbi:uncharacterized protein [Lepeophtheirus salmonis]|uniref:uncharacterized protein n=1 Tax=Lepeophtheirus salmonis TaxID=72036 RepID=UPI001AE2C7B6|nr:uncharacterized protein LOC121121206 [Lepeophtheirus salmonis]
MINPSSSSHLKNYPYLFVKDSSESESDYFCTLCESHIKEKEHKSHLFEGVHKGETLGDFFVRAEGPHSKGSPHFICVICWSKFNSSEDIPFHRNTCSSSKMPSSTSINVTSIPVPQQSVKLNEEEEGSKSEEKIKSMDTSSTLATIIDALKPPLGQSSSSSSRRRKQTQPQQHISQNTLPVFPPAEEDQDSSNNKNCMPSNEILSPMTTNCFQCSLCSVVLPSTISYIQHLKSFHRIASNAFDNNSNCPLCLTSISLLDLSDHLMTIHGLVPQTAVNSLILWVLTNFQKQIKNNNNNYNGSPKSFIDEDMDAYGKSLLQHQLKNSKPIMSSNPLIPIPPPPHTLLPPLQASGALPTQQHLLAAAILMNGGSMDGISPTHLHANILPASTNEISINDSNNNNSPVYKNKLSLSSIVGKLSRTHVSNNKQSFQCFLCSKWFALLPVKHMKLHILKFKQEKLNYTNLINGQVVCLSCYSIFNNPSEAAVHYEKHHGNNVVGEYSPNDVQEFVNKQNNYPHYPKSTYQLDLSESSPPGPPINLPLSLSMTVGPPLNLDSSNSTNELSQTTQSFSLQIPKGVELDNAGRVKSGKVRKQCELCGEWSNIKWFFKHMSEVHQALFCRCCREYLPIPEQEDHRRWHAEPPYMGQKIRIENGNPIIIDRKERASLTPIGSLAPWGGSSGGMVVKAMDEANGNGSIIQTTKKRKPYGSSHFTTNEVGSPIKIMNLDNPGQINSHKSNFISSANGNNNNTKDTLMPKETCPVCGILITYKNLARHIKLRHKIKYKFCHKCRKLVPNSTYDAHKASHSMERGNSNNTSNNQISIPNPLNLITNEVSIVPTSVPLIENNLIEIKKPDISQELMDLSLESLGKTDIQIGEESGSSEIMEHSEDSPIGDGRKSESFRANTSKTKLESLLGKEFKHPRRKCALCGYSVSYSNFKRHLRNAHLSEYLEVQNNPGAFKKALQTLALESEEMNALPGSDDEYGYEEEEEEDFIEGEEDESMIQKVECPECGDRILEEFLPRHMKMNHPSDKEDETNSDKNEETLTDAIKPEIIDENSPKTLICPFCSLQSEDPESLNKHTKYKHKTSIKWCDVCLKYLSKKTFKTHRKTHGNEVGREDDVESSLLISTSADEDDNQNLEATKKSVFTCQHCHKIFLAMESYQTHINENHPTESEPECSDSVEQS